MANNEILQIVVFSAFVAHRPCRRTAKEKAQAVLALVEQIASIMLRVTGYVMLFAPSSRCSPHWHPPRRRARRGHPHLHLCEIRGRVLCCTGHIVAAALRRGLCDPPRQCAVRRGAHAHAARFLHRQLRGRLSATAGEARRDRPAAQDRQFRAAAGLFVQPRRFDDVLHLRGALHRAGLCQHRSSRSASSSPCCCS